MKFQWDVLEEGARYSVRGLGSDCIKVSKVLPGVAGDRNWELDVKMGNEQEDTRYLRLRRGFSAASPKAAIKCANGVMALLLNVLLNGFEERQR